MTRTYSRIVNKMIWLGDASSGNGVAEDGHLQIKPFVTVSRDPGSGGKPIAQLLAKRLGFTFYDQELVSQIAKSVDARKEVLSQVDEKTRTKMDDFIHSVLNPEYVSERRFIKHLCKVVLSLSYEKNAVFLGRGTNFILPDAYGLNVRITAPYRVCVARAVEYEGVTHKKARQIIKKVTAERAGFVKQYFGKDVNKPKYYDVTVNTTHYDIEDTAKLLEQFFKKKIQT